MNSVPDISWFSMGILSLLLLIPIGVSVLFRLDLVRTMVASVLRMSIQLVFAGFYLIVLFDWENWLVNVVWFVGMIAIATGTMVRRSELNLRRFFVPSFLASAISIVFVLFFLNGLVVRVDNLLSAKYLIVLGGMLIGNSMRGIIIGIGNFYSNLQRNRKQLQFLLATGATLQEVIAPHFRKAMRDALNPIVATMMTLGLVWLPGMMTGQILGGSAPMIAIKYQIAVMVAIFTVTTMSVALTIYLSLRFGFDEFGNLKHKMFNK